MSDGSIVRADGFLIRRRGRVGWTLFALTLGVLVATLDDPGITWDEPPYFASAQLQVEWVKTLLSEGPAVALDRDVVYQMWDWDHYHNPHPPLYKEGMALTGWATSGLLGPLAAFRLFPAILFAGLVLVLFRWGCAAWGGLAGLGAAVSTALMPRLFGHAHLGATETPLMFGWVVATASLWWAIERNRWLGWVVAGLGWGFAMGTKFTGVAALAPALAWGLWRNPKAVMRGAPIAALSAVALFVALNPMMWVDASSFLGTWFWESTHRGEYVPIAAFYLGRQYGFDVPWHHVFVMTAATVPLGILSLAALGGASGIRRRDPPTILALGSVLFLWILMLLPAAPHHDGIRQFIVVFPFLGFLAGYGFHVTAGLLDKWRLAWTAGLFFLPALVQVAWTHPYQLAYYGEVVGGIRGAREAGFETTYWMDVVTEEVLTWMNENLPRDSNVFVVGSPETLVLAQEQGLLRGDFQLTQRFPADYVVVPMRQSMIMPEFREAVERTRPIYEVSVHGVRLLGIYEIGDSIP